MWELLIINATARGIFKGLSSAGQRGAVLALSFLLPLDEQHPHHRADSHGLYGALEEEYLS